MSVDVILGLQWGDEGKGKVVDALAGEYDVVARYQGGPNAGHTLIVNGKKFVLHSVPSGVFNDRSQNLMGNGVVIDPIVFAEEIKMLEEAGVDTRKKILISKKAHLILPTHRVLDAASEQAKGEEKIGSTLRGIGPAYMDKTGRNGLRAGDMVSKNFGEKFSNLKAKHMRLLSLYEKFPDPNEYEKLWMEGIELMRQYPLVDSEYWLNDQIDQGKKILAEGAQGAMLDVDFGTYPFVTSSSTTTAGVCTGLGIPPQSIREVIGISKAYCTRVGGGPFPTELRNEDGEKMRQEGKEFGATTGRPRRCGWIDLVQLRFACMVTGCTQIVITKADVLSSFEEIKICSRYHNGNSETKIFPFDATDSAFSPLFETLEGWKISNQNRKELPQSLVDFAMRIESETHCPVSWISTGPEREAMISR